MDETGTVVVGMIVAYLHYESMCVSAHVDILDKRKREIRGKRQM